jgi:hypothetical protein
MADSNQGGRAQRSEHVRPWFEPCHARSAPNVREERTDPELEACTSQRPNEVSPTVLLRVESRHVRPVAVLLRERDVLPLAPLGNTTGSVRPPFDSRPFCSGRTRRASVQSRRLRERRRAIDSMEWFGHPAVSRSRHRLVVDLPPARGDESRERPPARDRRDRSRRNGPRYKEYLKGTYTQPPYSDITCDIRFPVVLADIVYDRL